MIITTQMTWSFLLGAMNTVSSSPSAARLSLISFVTHGKPLTDIAKSIFFWGMREFCLPMTNRHSWCIPERLNPCRIHSDQELSVQGSQTGRYPVKRRLSVSEMRLTDEKSELSILCPQFVRATPNPGSFGCCSPWLWSLPGGSPHGKAFWKQHVDFLPVQLDVVNLTFY